ncbi:MAG: ECF transporter S component [Coriobacteriia bacterium]|nr:ECF transporter S component [Coriobacteriia bacterium]
MNLLLSSIAIAVLLLLVIIAFERVRPRPRDLMPVVVLAALAVLGRVVSMPVPNFQPATALIILAGVFFGRHAGLLCGMVVALLSNMLLGQGPWTLWQMFAWGLVGYGAGLLFYRETGVQMGLRFSAAVILYGAAASLLYGLFLDLQFFVAYAFQTGWAGFIATLGMGMPLNLMHAASTVVFLALTVLPWGKKFQRLRLKYGIRGS